MRKLGALLIVLLLASACSRGDNATPTGPSATQVAETPTADPLVRHIRLIPTGSDPDAAGRAQIASLTRHGGVIEETFAVAVHQLDASTSFQLVVDSNVIATFTTNRGGAATLRFSKPPRGHAQALPASLDPVTNIKVVEVRTLTGQVILRGTFI